MNSQIFTYSLLRYIHSQATGEVINVGILFIFPEQKHIIFKSPSRLNRLKGLYRNFSEWQLKAYLQGFHRRSIELNQQLDIFSDRLLKSNFADFISSNFLVEDATALQFDEVKTGVLYSSDVNQVAEDYYNIYFSHYQELIETRVKHDEEYVLKRYKKLLVTKNKEIERYLQPGITITSDTTSFKSDIVWQNGTKNLVKSVSFDLLDSDNINKKSLEYFARLNFLSDIAKENHYRFDLLLSRPQDRKLYDAYGKAVDILRRSPAPATIVEESDFDKYSTKTIEEIVKE